MACLKEAKDVLSPHCLFQATSLATMTILGLEACLLAPAMLELDELETLHQVNTNDLQLVQS